MAEKRWEKRRALLQELKLSIDHFLQSCKSEEGAPTVSDPTPQLDRMCLVVELILRYGLKDKSTFFTKKDYWNYLELLVKVDPSAVDCIKSIAEMPHIKTPLGRGRAWIRYALMEKCLDVYIKSLADEQSITKEWYENYAVLRSEFDTKQLLDLLSPLSTVNFNLCLKDIDFDALPHDLKAYTLVEMEEWDDSSRETSTMEEKRSSSDLVRLALESELDKLRAELEILKQIREQVGQLTDKLQVAENERLKKESENESLRKQIDEHEQRLREKQEAFTSMEAQLRDRNEAWEVERILLQESKSKLEEQNKLLEEAARRREGDYLVSLAAEKENKRLVKDKKREIERLESELQRIEQQSSATRERLEAEIEDLKSQRKQWEEKEQLYLVQTEELKSYKEKGKQWQSQLDAVLAEKHQLEASLKEKAEHLVELEQSLKRAQHEAKENESLSKRVRELVEELARVHGEVEKGRLKLTQSEQQREALLQETDRRYKDELVALRAERDELDKQLARLRESNDEARKSQESELKSIKTDKLQLEAALNEMRAELQNRKEKLEVASDVTRKLEENIASLKESHTEALAERDQEKRARKQEKEEREKAVRESENLRLENERKDREMKRLEEKAEMKEREITQMQSKLEGREDSNLEEVKMRRVLEEKVKALEDQIESKQQEADTKELRVRELDRELERARAKLQEQSDELGRKSQEVDNLQSAATEKEERLREIARLRTELAKSEEGHKRAEDLKAQVERLMEQIAVKDGQLREAEARQQEHDDALRSARARESVTFDEVKQLGESLQAIRDENEALKAQLNVSAQEVERLQLIEKELRSELTTKQELLEKTKHDSESAATDDLKRTRAELDDLRGLLEAAKNESQSKIEGLTMREQELKEQVGHLEEKCRSVQEQREQFAREKEELGSKIEEVEHIVRQAKDDHMRREAQLTSTIEELEEMRDTSAQEHSRHVEDLNQKLSQLAYESKAKESDLEALREEVKELREELEVKGKLLAQRKDELERVERELKHEREIRKEQKKEWKATLAAKELRIIELEGSLTSASGKESQEVVNRLREELSRAQTELASARERVSAFASRDADNKREFEDMKRRIEAILMIERSGEAQLLEERRARQDLQRALDAKEQEFTAIRGKLELSKAKRKQYKQQFKTRETEIVKQGERGLEEIKDTLQQKLKETEVELNEMNKLAADAKREQDKAIEEKNRMRTELDTKTKELEKSLTLVERTLKECTELMQAMEILKKKERDLSDELKRERDLHTKAREDELKRHHEKLAQVESMYKAQIAELEQVSNTHREQVEVLKKLLAIKETEISEIKEQTVEMRLELDRLHREHIEALSQSQERSLNQSLIMDETPSTWVPDEAVTQCPTCSNYFGITRRKHHCRHCGGVFCGSCSAQQAIIPTISSRPVRVCNDCHKLLKA